MAHMNLLTLLPTLLGGRKRNQANQPHEEKSAMHDFSHLNGIGGDIQKTAAKIRANNGDDSEKAFVKAGDPTKLARPGQHSRGHNVAVSDEGKANPILAVSLLKETDLKSSQIKARCASEPQALSKFTQNFMEEHDPGWEFQDGEEQALTAQTYSINNRDENGFHAARDRAIKALKKMEEPLTEDEIKDLTARTIEMKNASEPNTPDNVEARKKADEEYKQEVALATARRNDRYRASGQAIPGDTRRVNGRIEGPADEVDRLKSQLPG
ncbi:hypothetical protein [Edaphovirga cremea]|uniref:hypothetical protein n=1 Tax=Edaphovirga cremea TaxID=2267246 RepID=UPI0039899839